MFTRSRAAYLMLCVGALTGAWSTELLLYRDIGVLAALRWGYWPGLNVEGAIAGALLVNFAWILINPRRRLRRSAAIAVVANAAVWVAFLLLTPPLTLAQFVEIDSERARREADSAMTLMSHQPVIVAGRMVGTYWSINIMDRPLHLFAGPAIQYAALIVVPIRYGTANATRPESFVIAGAAFVLSTAFWAVFAPGVTSLARWYRTFRRRTGACGG